MASHAPAVRSLQAVLLLCSSLTVMSGATIAPALPSIAAHFEGHPQSDLLVRLVLTIPALFIGLGAPFAGHLLERYGRLPVLRAGIVLYAFSGSAPLWITPAVAQLNPWLPSWMDALSFILLSRAFLGISVAALMTATTTLAGDYFQGEARNRFLGIQGSFMAFGGVVFISLGGWLASLRWEAPFSLYALSVLLLPAAYRILYEPKGAQNEQRQAKDKSSTSPVKLNWSLLFPIYFAGFFGMMMFYAIPTQVPFYLEHGLGVAPAYSGLIIASSTLAAATISFNYAKIRRRMSFALIFTFAFALLSAGYLALGLAFNVWTVVLALMLSGCGAGLTMPNANLWLMHVAPEQVRGKLMGGMTASIFTGQFFSPLLITPVRDWFNTSILFEILAIPILGMSVLYFLLNRRTTNPRTQREVRQ